MNKEIYIHCALIEVQMCIRKTCKAKRNSDFLRVNVILQSNNLNNTGEKLSFRLNYASGSRFSD